MSEWSLEIIIAKLESLARLEARLEAYDKALALALQQVTRAEDKANEALEKRLDAHNHIAAAMDKQVATFITRNEFDIKYVAVGVVQERLKTVENRYAFLVAIAGGVPALLLAFAIYWLKR